MAKVIGKEDLDRILKIDAENFCDFVRRIFELYPNGIDMSDLTSLDCQKFRAKEWSYSVYGDIRYNDRNMVCKRCDSIKVAKLVYGDEFMRVFSNDKRKSLRDITRLKCSCLSINVSATKSEDSKDYFCLTCGYEW